MTEEEKKQKMALFRYSLIASAVSGTFEAPSLMQHFRNIAEKTYPDPCGGIAQPSCHTLERWYYTYKKYGLNALEPKKRRDTGKSRALPERAINQIYVYKEKFPYITGKAIYKKLVEEGFINASETSLATVHRFLRNNGLKTTAATEVVKAFEMEFANVCWQTDTSNGPKIRINGRSFQTYLIAFIDDKSRMILHSQFYFEDNAVNMQDCFKKAIAKAGVPQMVFADNGGPYDNLQLRMICASLGITLIHAKVNSGKSKGKIERHFRTVKDGWMNCTDWDTFSSIEDVDASLSKFLSKEYTNSIHSSIGRTPKESFMEDYERIRFIPQEALDFHFLHRRESRVSSTAIVKFSKMEYEAPQQYIGSKVKIRYLPLDKSKAFIFSDDNKLLHTIYPVKKIDNSKIKRIAIDYAKGGV